MESPERPDRSHYPIRKFRLGDTEADDDDLSATTTAAERLEIMWTLAKMNWAFMGQPQDAARLQRHVVRIQRSRD
jgi:hypothetical protein